MTGKSQFDQKFNSTFNSTNQQYYSKRRDSAGALTDVELGTANMDGTYSFPSRKESATKKYCSSLTLKCITHHSVRWFQLFNIALLAVSFKIVTETGVDLEDVASTSDFILGLEITDDANCHVKNKVV